MYEKVALTEVGGGAGTHDKKLALVGGLSA
jgi:hypothetical protein